jgi:hypothetical protein
MVTLSAHRRNMPAARCAGRGWGEFEKLTGAIANTKTGAFINRAVALSRYMQLQSIISRTVATSLIT